MKSNLILKILLASFFSLLYCQNNLTSNLNQSSGTVLCYNCSNISIENCDTLCSGVNCYIYVTLPLSANNIASYGCSSEFVDFGCVNDTTTDGIMCYCTGDFCNYLEVVDIAEINSTTEYFDEESVSTASFSSTDYYTSENPFLINNISKRSVNEADNNTINFINVLQYLDQLFEFFDDVPIKNETESIMSLDEDKILQMLDRLDYIFDKKITKLSESLNDNISSIANLISENSGSDKYSKELKIKKTNDFVYNDYENSGVSSRSSFYSNLWKRILKLYFYEKSFKNFNINDKSFYYYDQKETIFDIENAVVTYSFEFNAFVLESPDKNINYKHNIVKRDYPPENINLLQSIVTFITSFITSFGEKLGIVAGSVGKNLINGLQMAIQEQMSQTINAANIAFNTYTDVLFSKIFTIFTTYINKAQSMKKRSLNAEYSNRNLLNSHKQFYDFVNTYKKIEKTEKRASNYSKLENEFSLESTERPIIMKNILEEIPYYNTIIDNSNETKEEYITPPLADTLNPNLSDISDLPILPSNLASFETKGSFSVTTNNNSQFSNMSLTTIGKKNNSNVTDIGSNSSTTASIIATIESSTVVLYTTTSVMTTTASQTTAPMDTIENTVTTTTKAETETTIQNILTTTVSMNILESTVTTTTKIETTTTASSGYFSYIFKYIKSFFGFGSSSLTTTTMAPLPSILKDQLPPNVKVNDNGEYTFTNGTIISPSQLEEMLQKLGRTLYPTTTKSSNFIVNIITSVTNSVYTFIAAFVNEFNTNFNNANNNSVGKVKNVFYFPSTELVGQTTTPSSIENSTTILSPYKMLTGLLSAVTSSGRKKRELNNDLNGILNNILPNIGQTSANTSNIQKLEKTFKKVLSDEKLFNIFIDYITKNLSLSIKEKSQLSKTIFQTVVTFISNSTLGRMMEEKMTEFSRTDLFDEDYGETYTEKMGQSMKEMGEVYGKTFNTILESVLLATNDYNGMNEIDIEEKMHNDGYQLGIKIGFAIKPILVNLNTVIQRIEKRKKRFVDCINDLYCFQDVLGKDL
uniref:Secreted protein n=1 Tax=Strongyloides stercoralis TaxID=6248 RepID=A0A0K0EFU0_STRER